MLQEFVKGFPEHNVEGWLHMDPDLLTSMRAFCETDDGVKDICTIIKELQIIQEQLPSTSPMGMDVVTLDIVDDDSRTANIDLDNDDSVAVFRSKMDDKPHLKSVFYDESCKTSDETIVLKNYKGLSIEGTILHGLSANTLIKQGDKVYEVYFPRKPSIVKNISTGSGYYFMNLSSSQEFDDRITSPNYQSPYTHGAKTEKSVRKCTKYSNVIGDVLHVTFNQETQSCTPSIINQDVVNYCKLHATDPHETVGNRYSVSLQFANDFTSNVESLVDRCLSHVDQTYVHELCSNLSGTMYDARAHLIQAMQQIQYPIQSTAYDQKFTYLTDTFQFFAIGLEVENMTCIVPFYLYLPLKIPAHYVQINHTGTDAQKDKSYGVAIEAGEVCEWLKGPMEEPLTYNGVRITKADIRILRIGAKEAKKIMSKRRTYQNCSTFSAFSTLEKKEFHVDYQFKEEKKVVYMRESIIRELFFVQMKKKCLEGVPVKMNANAAGDNSGTFQKYTLDVDMVLDNFDLHFGWLMLWHEKKAHFLSFKSRYEFPQCAGSSKWNPFVQKISEGSQAAEVLEDDRSPFDPLQLVLIDGLLYAAFNEYFFDENTVFEEDESFIPLYTQFYDVHQDFSCMPMEWTFEAEKMLLNHPIRKFIVDSTRRNWTDGMPLIAALNKFPDDGDARVMKEDLAPFFEDDYTDADFESNVATITQNVQTVLNRFFGLSEKEKNVDAESFLVVQMYDTNKLVAFAMLADLSKKDVQECRRSPRIKLNKIGPMNAYEVAVLRYSNRDPIVSRVVPDSRLRDIGVTAISGRNAFEVMINVLTQLSTIYEKPCIGRVVQPSSQSPIRYPSLSLPLNDKDEDELSAISYPIINCKDAHEDDFCIPALVPNTTHRIISLTLSTHICEIMLSNRQILTLPRKAAFISEDARYNGIVQRVPSKFIDPRVVLQDRKHVRCALSSAPAKGDGPSSFEGHFWIIDTWPQDVIKRLWTKLQPDDCRVFRALENDNASFALLSDDSIQIWCLSKLYDPTHPYDDRDLIQKLLQPFVRHDQLQFTPDTPYDRRVVYKHKGEYRYVPLLCNQWNGLPEVFLKHLRANPRSLVYCMEANPDPHPNAKGYVRYNVVLNRNRFIPIRQQSGGESGEYEVLTTTEKGDDETPPQLMSSRKWTTDISTITTDGNVYANCGYHLVVSDSTLLRKTPFKNIKCGAHTIECPPHIDHDLEKTHVVDRMADSKHATYVSMGVPFAVPDTKQHLRVLLTPDCKCTMLAYTIYAHEPDVSGSMQHDLSSKLSAVLPHCVVHVQALALQEAANAEHNSSIRVLHGEKVLIPATSAPTTGFAQRLVIATIGLMNALHDDTKTSQMTAVKDRMREVFKNKDVHIEELAYFLGIAVDLENCNATDTIGSNAVIGISDQNRHITIKNGALAIDGVERPVHWNDGAPSDVFGHIVDVNPVPNGGVTIRCRSGIERIINPTKQFRARGATTKALYYALTKLTLL